MFKTKKIIIPKIDINDCIYKISSDIDLTYLAGSINAMGLINLPVVKQKGNNFIIVSGFRRIRAMILNNTTTIEAKIIPENFSGRKTALISITENAFQRPLNTIEQVKGIVLLKKFMDKNEIAEKSMSIFNLKMNPSLVEKLFLLGSMSERLHDLIETDNFSMTAALRLTRYDTDTIDAFISLFGTIKTGLNKQLEIITNIHEIAAREGTAPLLVMNSKDIRDIIDDKDLDNSRKGGLLRSYLAKRRYPRLKEAEENFKANLKQLRPGKDLNLSAPMNFEAADYNCSFKFKNYSELEKRIKKLEKISHNPILKRMIP